MALVNVVLGNVQAFLVIPGLDLIQQLTLRPMRLYIVFSASMLQSPQCLCFGRMVIAFNKVCSTKFMDLILINTNSFTRYDFVILAINIFKCN